MGEVRDCIAIDEAYWKLNEKAYLILSDRLFTIKIAFVNSNSKIKKFKANFYQLFNSQHVLVHTIQISGNHLDNLSKYLWSVNIGEILSIWGKRQASSIHKPAIVQLRDINGAVKKSQTPKNDLIVHVRKYSQYRLHSGMRAA